MIVPGLYAGFRPPSEIFGHSKDYTSCSSYSDNGVRSVFISVFLYLGKTFHFAEIRTSSPVKENPNENESQRKYSAITPVLGHHASTRPSGQYSAPFCHVFGHSGRNHCSIPYVGIRTPRYPVRTPYSASPIGARTPPPVIYSDIQRKGHVRIRPA
ncbi:unnamed protein product [Amaranthus hypochondriacus]